MSDTSFSAPGCFRSRALRLRNIRRVPGAAVAATVLIAAACGAPVESGTAEQFAAPTTVTATTTVTTSSEVDPAPTSTRTSETPSDSGASNSTIEQANEQATSQGERNALRSAEDYLTFAGFSRSGLVEQLQFEGYTTDEATYAVDNVDADWNAQAVRSAELYAGMMGFSRTGLIDQLQFDGFTAEQAAHGANSVGL